MMLTDLGTFGTNLEQTAVQDLLNSFFLAAFLAEFWSPSFKEFQGLDSKDEQAQRHGKLMQRNQRMPEACYACPLFAWYVYSQAISVSMLSSRTVALSRNNKLSSHRSFFPCISSGCRLLICLWCSFVTWRSLLAACLRMSLPRRASFACLHCRAHSQMVNLAAPTTSRALQTCLLTANTTCSTCQT